MGRANRLSAIRAAMQHGSDLLSDRPLLVTAGIPLLNDIQRAGPAFLAKFESKINRTGECHLWEASTIRFGYGRIKLFGRSRMAHRISWVIANQRDIPAQMVICHRCDNPRCVNPEHLWLGTHKDNMIDMYLKGRGASTRARGGVVMLADQLPNYIFHGERFA